MKAFEFKPKLFTTLQNNSKESFMHLVSLREFPQKKASSLLL